MNNVIILGKVLSKSSIHFDYLDKVKVYFSIRVLESSNIFEIVLSEGYIDIQRLNIVYKMINIGCIVCAYGSITKEDSGKYIFVCKEIFI